MQSAEAVLAMLRLLRTLCEGQRLLEACQLLLSGDLDATRAAYRVGYQDVSHLNLEYKSP